MIDLSGHDDLSVVRYLDDKIDSNIKSLLQDCSEYSYGPEDLDKKVNDSETLREYILDTENTFKLKRERKLESYSRDELTLYVASLDKLYSGVIA